MARPSTTPRALTGAHAKVACGACHTRDTNGVARFSFASALCVDCHADPHKGEFDRYTPRTGTKKGCESCHCVESFQAALFDHSSTRFPLLGAHGRVACSACHKTGGSAVEKGPTRLTGPPLACDGCHRDVHARQFRGPEGGTASRANTPAWPAICATRPRGARTHASFATRASRRGARTAARP